MDISGLDRKYMAYGMLFAVSNRIQTFGDEQLTDITMKQHFMMVVLQMCGEHSPTLSELADLVGCSYQNIKRMAANLEKNNYVSIVEDDKDKRKRLIVITDKFRKMGENSMKMTQSFMEGLYSGISEDELGCVINVLKKMENNIKDMSKAEKNN